MSRWRPIRDDEIPALTDLSLRSKRERLADQISTLERLVPWPALLQSLRVTLGRIDAEVARRGALRRASRGADGKRWRGPSDGG